MERFVQLQGPVDGNAQDADIMSTIKDWNPKPVVDPLPRPQLHQPRLKPNTPMEDGGKKSLEGNGDDAQRLPAGRWQVQLGGVMARSHPLSQVTDPDNTTVLVDTISGCVSEDELRAFFESFGHIIYVKSHLGKEQASIQFTERHAAEMAIDQPQGYQLRGSHVVLSWDNSKKDSTAVGSNPGRPESPASSVSPQDQTNANTFVVEQNGGASEPSLGSPAKTCATPEQGLPPNKSASPDHDLDEDMEEEDAPGPSSGLADAFPPGQDQPGFVPIGVAGVANAAQGNSKQALQSLRGAVVVAEYAAGLKYPEIRHKYGQWGVTEDRIRGMKRNTTLLPKHRPIEIIWRPEDVRALREGVAANTAANGKISWPTVQKYILQQVDKWYSPCKMRVKMEEIGEHEDDEDDDDDDDDDEDDE